MSCSHTFKGTGRCVHCLEPEADIIKREYAASLKTIHEQATRIAALTEELEQARAEANAHHSALENSVIEVARLRDELRKADEAALECASALTTERAAREQAERERDAALQRVKELESQSCEHVMPGFPICDRCGKSERTIAAESALASARALLERCDDEFYFDEFDDPAQLQLQDDVKAFLSRIRAEATAALCYEGDCAKMTGRARPCPIHDEQPQLRTRANDVQLTEEEQDWFLCNGYGSNAGPEQLQHLIGQLQMIAPLLSRAGLYVSSTPRAELAGEERAVLEACKSATVETLSNGWRMLDGESNRLDTVALLQDIPKLGLCRGLVGLVVRTSRDPRVCDVEFVLNPQGETKLVRSIETGLLLPLAWPGVR